MAYCGVLLTGHRYAIYLLKICVPVKKYYNNFFPCVPPSPPPPTHDSVTLSHPDKKINNFGILILEKRTCFILQYRDIRTCLICPVVGRQKRVASRVVVETAVAVAVGGIGPSPAVVGHSVVVLLALQYEKPRLTDVHQEVGVLLH